MSAASTLRKASRFRSGLALLVAVALTVTACGSSGSGGESGGTTTAGGNESSTGAGGGTTETSASKTADDTAGEAIVVAAPTDPVPDDLLKAAQAEGEVQWYTAATTYQPVVDAFEKAYGIKVIANRQNSGALSRQYLTEAASGAVVADIIQAFDPLRFDEAASKGYFMKTPVDKMPNLAKLPKDLITSEYYFPSNSWIWGTVWNTNLVPDGIKTWDDLLKPELKGQIVLADPRLGGVSAAFANWMYDTLGEDYMKKLGDQQLQLVDSNVAALDRLAAGEISVVVPTNKNNPDPLIAKGAPLQFGAPDTTSWFSHDVAISANAKHPNAAILLANFLLSKVVQNAVSIPGPPIRPDVPSSNWKMLPTYSKLLPEDVTQGVERKDLFTKILQLN